MTAQRNDTFIFSDVSYLLLGISGDSILFDPTEWGLKPTRISTAVQRGFLCEYGVEEGRIVLVNVRIRVEDGRCPVIGDVSAEESPDNPTVCQYNRPNVHINHTGSLLIGQATNNALGRIGFVEFCHAQNLIELVCVAGHIDRIIPNPSDIERFDNYWTKHVGIAMSLPLRNEFNLAPLSQ